MKRRFLLVGAVLLVLVFVVYGYRLLKQPATGVVTNTLSDRMREFVAEHEQGESVLTTERLQYDPASDPNRQLQVVTTDCFTLHLERPIAYLKTRSETSDETQQQPNCFVGGAFESPRSQLTITAEYRPDLVQLDEHTGVTLRQREVQQYTSIEVQQLGGEQYRAFQSESELIAIWSKDQVVYTVVLFNLARVSEDAQMLFSELLDALELDEAKVNSVY